MLVCFHVQHALEHVENTPNTKTYQRGCGFMFGVFGGGAGHVRVENRWGGVETTLFAVKEVEREWGGVEPTLLVSKHVEEKWGGVEPTLFVSKPLEMRREIGRVPTPPLWNC